MYSPESPATRCGWRSAVPRGQRPRGGHATCERGRHSPAAGSSKLFRASIEAGASYAETRDIGSVPTTLTGALAPLSFT